ncbi:DNA-directed RNA polymerase subunit L [Candidatus Woesearchaeota archaeon]|nr:DNA-directed RNA polymerase subunit L [Candidatus Woesearchaeota archaeon]
MEIEVRNKEKESLKIEIKKEGHTLVNLIRKELWEDKTVQAAGYEMKHALVDTPILFVESKDPKKSLKEAAQRLQKKNAEVKQKFEKSLK